MSNGDIEERKSKSIVGPEPCILERACILKWNLPQSPARRLAQNGCCKPHQVSTMNDHRALSIGRMEKPELASILFRTLALRLMVFAVHNAKRQGQTAA